VTRDTAESFAGVARFHNNRWPIAKRSKHRNWSSCRLSDGINGLHRADFQKGGPDERLAAILPILLTPSRMRATRPV
jgi:hypothetical protein